MTLAVRHHIASDTDIKAVKFITCYLLPPPKKAVLAHLGIPLAPGREPEPQTPIIRKAEIDVRNNDLTLIRRGAECTGVVFGCCEWVRHYSIEQAFVLISSFRHSYNVILSLGGAKWTVDTFEKLPESVHPQISVEELLECEMVVKGDARIQRLAADVGEPSDDCL